MAKSAKDKTDRALNGTLRTGFLAAALGTVGLVGVREYEALQDAKRGSSATLTIKDVRERESTHNMLAAVVGAGAGAVLAGACHTRRIKDEREEEEKKTAPRGASV